MTVELFRAECKLCDRMEGMIRAILPSGVDLVVHRAQDCRDGSCCRRAEAYGVRAVPTLVVDGQVVQVGLPDSPDLHSLETRLHHLFSS